MSKTLLLADDSVVIQKLVGLSFANEDVEIVSTDNGDDAVTRAREIRPDVVLADVVMPGKSGYEVCEAIKKDAALAHIPVLLLTGTFEAFDESRASGVGADGHITKPFEAQALVERVKTVIKNAARPPVVARPSSASAPVRTADDLFEEAETLLAPARGESGFFGQVDSLDVTPSLSEEDLSDSLDTDLFGPPGDVGGPSFGSERTPRMAIELPADEDATRFADAPIEDATIAFMPEPPAPLSTDSGRSGSVADDLGLDEPLEVADLPLGAFDLDAAFDPAPPSPARSTLQVARDDANASTSRSLDRSGFVADLDEILATPAPIRASTPPVVRPEIRPGPRPEPRPEPPTALDLGPVERSASEFDFAFDVSEQAPAAPQADLLEDSFSSLLDVSESQVLGEPPTAAPEMSSTQPKSGTTATLTSAVADFDVSSSDLATAGSAFASPLPGPAAGAPPEPSITASVPVESVRSTSPPAAAVSAPKPRSDMEFFLADAPPLMGARTGVAPAPAASAAPSSAAPAMTVPASAAGGDSSSRAAVSHMSPILQQQVQETLEKVAWEAFSDLSETIVKQVIERVERIAWEVIPQMAETLVREEIRKMKGEED